MDGKTASLFGADELPLQLTPPGHFRRLPRKLDVEFCCPRCAYGWAGNPKPNAEDAAAEVETDGGDGA